MVLFSLLSTRKFVSFHIHPISHTRSPPGERPGRQAHRESTFEYVRCSGDPKPGRASLCVPGRAAAKSRRVSLRSGDPRGEQRKGYRVNVSTPRSQLDAVGRWRCDKKKRKVPRPVRPCAPVTRPAGGGSPVRLYASCRRRVPRARPLWTGSSRWKEGYSLLRPVRLDRKSLSPPLSPS